MWRDPGDAWVCAHVPGLPGVLSRAGRSSRPGRWPAAPSLWCSKIRGRAGGCCQSAPDRDNGRHSIGRRSASARTNSRNCPTTIAAVSTSRGVASRSPKPSSSRNERPPPRLPRKGSSLAAEHATPRMRPRTADGRVPRSGDRTRPRQRHRLNLSTSPVGQFAWRSPARRRAMMPSAASTTSGCSPRTSSRSCSSDMAATRASEARTRGFSTSHNSKRLGDGSDGTTPAYRRLDTPKTVSRNMSRTRSSRGEMEPA